MKINTVYYFVLLFGMLSISTQCFAQEIEATWNMPTDDLGNVSDDFQENFFEALKQKGIENYELALVALSKAEKAANNNSENIAVVYFEMGKNLTYLKRYDEAEEKFNKVIQLEGDRIDVIEALYDLYYEQKNYQAAISIVIKLIKVDDDYKEDLANLYLRTEQFEKALEILDELDEDWGESTYRDALRTRIYRRTGNTKGEIKNLETKIEENPKNEQDYLKLIFLYSEEGDTKKAFETAKILLQKHPNSKLVHLSLYKFYLDKGNATEAINSMKIVFGSQQVDREPKYIVLSDFIEFVNNNPEYEGDLEETISLFSNETSGIVYQQLGDYYLAKGRKDRALHYYEIGITMDSDNFALLKNTLLLQIEFKKFVEVAKLSSEALEIFPAQPIIYLFNGVAENELNNPEAAIESLEMGVDYLLNDLTMERDFYEQLGKSYQLLGDSKKAEVYLKQASELAIDGNN
jgi:tetratricopeptide (TPR) repeat protein